MSIDGRLCTGTLFAYPWAMVPGSWLSAAGLVFTISLLVVLAALIVVPRNRKPGSATAWLMLIPGVPIVGAVMIAAVDEASSFVHVEFYILALDAVTDDDIAVIGSSNLDMRSFTLNLEVTPVAYDAGVVADLRCVEKEFLKRSDELLAEEWDQRWLPGRVLDNVARLTAALQ
jgi:hypothetical protein